MKFLLLPLCRFHLYHVFYFLMTEVRNFLKRKINSTYCNTTHLSLSIARSCNYFNTEAEDMIDYNKIINIKFSTTLVFTTKFNLDLYYF